MASPPKIRIASTQSVDSRLTGEIDEPLSPLLPPQENSFTAVVQPPISQVKEPVKVDVACPKPGDDVTATDDGPVFRATLKALEQKTGNMRAQMKKVLKRAEQANFAQTEANDAFGGFIESLREASGTNANAVQPALEHYFDKIAREILAYQRSTLIIYRGSLLNQFPNSTSLRSNKQSQKSEILKKKAKTIMHTCRGILGSARIRSRLRSLPTVIQNTKPRGGISNSSVLTTRALCKIFTAVARSRKFSHNLPSTPMRKRKPFVDIEKGRNVAASIRGAVRRSSRSRQGISIPAARTRREETCPREEQYSVR